MDSVERSRTYLRQLAPHVREREAAHLITELADEIERLRVALTEALGIFEHMLELRDARGYVIPPRYEVIQRLRAALGGENDD